MTELGFEKREIPPELYDFIWEHRRPFELKTERCPKSAHQNCDRISEGKKEVKANSAIMNVLEPRVFKETLGESLRPILEEWSGVELELTEVYGIRRYREGAWLQLHVDRLKTHVVSAILQVRKGLDCRVLFRHCTFSLSTNRSTRKWTRTGRCCW